jgi:hypothetical protein
MSIITFQIKIFEPSYRIPACPAGADHCGCHFRRFSGRDEGTAPNPGRGVGVVLYFVSNESETQKAPQKDIRIIKRSSGSAKLQV